MYIVCSVRVFIERLYSQWLQVLILREQIVCSVRVFTSPQLLLQVVPMALLLTALLLQLPLLLVLPLLKLSIALLLAYYRRGFNFCSPLSDVGTDASTDVSLYLSSPLQRLFRYARVQHLLCVARCVCCSLRM